MSDPCCSVARAIGPKKLAKLDAELRDPAHRSFAKLAAAYGAKRSSVEVHKKICLGLGVPKPHLDHASVPKSDPLPVRVLDNQAGRPERPENVQDPTALARAPVSAIAAKTRAERVAWIVQDMLARRPENRFDAMAEVGTLAGAWQISETTVREYIRSAEDALRLNRGDVQAARTQAEVDQKIIRDLAMKAGDFAAANAAQKELNRITGAVDTSKTIKVVVTNTPEFMALVDATLDALVPFPAARAAVVARWTQTAKELEQPAPTVFLTTGEDVPGEAA